MYLSQHSYLTSVTYFSLNRWFWKDLFLAVSFGSLLTCIVIVVVLITHFSLFSEGKALKYPVLPTHFLPSTSLRSHLWSSSLQQSRPSFLEVDPRIDGCITMFFFYQSGETCLRHWLLLTSDSKMISTHFKPTHVYADWFWKSGCGFESFLSFFLSPSLPFLLFLSSFPFFFLSLSLSLPFSLSLFLSFLS